MQKINISSIIVIIILTKTITFSLYSNLINQDSVELITQLTHQTYNRYYFNKRLNKLMQSLQTLQKCEQSVFNNLGLSDEIDLSNFTILNHLHNKEKKLTPIIFELWEEVKAYKSINNENFIKEFITLLSLYTSMIINTLEGKSKHPIKAKNSIPAILQTLDNQHNYIKDRINGTKPCCKMEHDLIDESEDNDHYIGAISITLRIYLLNRLKRPFRKFKQYKCIKVILPTDMTFNNEAIMNLYLSMKTEESIIPLLKMYREIKQFHYIDDLQLIKEFLSLSIFTIHALQNHEDMSEESTQDTIDILPQTKNIEQLLEDLDMQTSHLNL